MTQASEFTPTGYEALIRGFLGRGYAVRDFTSAKPAKAHLILRHDVDMSLDAALEISGIESSLGVQATYFVLLRSEFYNPLTPMAADALAKIRSQGHRIGLHFDASLYPADRATLEAAAGDECRLLENLTGAAIETISFHRPAPSLLNLDGSFAGRQHAYAPRFFREIGYCSDSRGGWHHGHPTEHPSVVAGKALQLLTHPIWWTGAAGESPQGRLDRFALDRHSLLRNELARNCDIYSPTGPECSQ